MELRRLRGVAAAAASAALMAKAGLVALDVTAMGAKGDGVTDDTVAIQQAIDKVRDSNTSYVSFSKPGTYIVSWVLQNTVPTKVGSQKTALLHYANVTVHAVPGVTVKLADNSNCAIIRNASGKDGDANCVLLGGTWDGNNTAQTQNVNTYPKWAGHGLCYINCDAPVIAPDKCINHYKYAIYLFYCNNATVGDVLFATASDGVHLEASRGTTLVGTIRGYCHDQALAHGTRPGFEYYEEECDIPATMTVGRLYCDGIWTTGGLSPFRAFGALGDTFEPFYIGPSGGVVDTGDFAQLSDDGPSLTGATIKHAHFESIDAVVQNGYALVRCGNCRTLDVSIGRLATTAAQNNAIVLEATVEVTLQAGYTGTPTKGATITQQTSGATGKVKGIVGSTLYLTWISGTWTTSGSLTLTQSSPSGWTATGTAAVITGTRSVTIDELDCVGNTTPAVSQIGPVDTLFIDRTRVLAGANGRLYSAGTYGNGNSVVFRSGLFEGDEIAFYFSNGAGRTHLKHGLHLRARSGGNLNPYYAASSGKASITVDGPIYQIGTGTVLQAIGSGTELDYGGNGDRCLSTAGVPLGKGSYPTYGFLSGGKIRINNPDAYTEVTNTSRINDAKTGDYCTHNGAGGTLTTAGRLARYDGSAWTYS